MRCPSPWSDGRCRSRSWRDLFPPSFLFLNAAGPVVAPQGVCGVDRPDADVAGERSAATARAAAEPRAPHHYVP
eukprot:scaffold1792_cov124-Isochrysis_galbana.AAC.2